MQLWRGMKVSTVDPRQAKKFTRAGREKTGRKPKQHQPELSIQEVDSPVLFEVPDVAQINPTRAQLQARHEDGMLSAGRTFYNTKRQLLYLWHHCNRSLCM